MIKTAWLLGAALATLTLVNTASAQEVSRAALTRRDPHASPSAQQRGAPLEARKVVAAPSKQRTTDSAREKGRALSAQPKSAGRTGSLRGRR
jgi:hypothetical protein